MWCFEINKIVELVDYIVTLSASYQSVFRRRKAALWPFNKQGQRSIQDFNTDLTRVNKERF